VQIPSSRCGLRKKKDVNPGYRKMSLTNFFKIKGGIQKLQALYHETSATFTSLSKRFSLPPRQVSKFIKQADSGVALHHHPKRFRFKVITPEARRLIDTLLQASHEKVTAKVVKEHLQLALGLTLSEMTILRYLKDVLRLKHKKVYPVKKRANLLECKLQRQYAAGQLVAHLYSGAEVINIDESSISCTDSRLQGWGVRGRKSYKMDS
jgi:hypothetical protein